MKLRNKQTGEIVVFGEGIVDLNIIGCKNVGEMIEAGWTDYEEPKDIWWLDNEGNANHTHEFDDIFKKNKEIGNYFKTKEEAEKAVEKLKAWKRLKDKGFRFTGWATNEGIRGIDFEVPDSFFSEHNHSCISDETRDDLDLLFSGKDD